MNCHCAHSSGQYIQILFHLLITDCRKTSSFHQRKFFMLILLQFFLSDHISYIISFHVISCHIFLDDNTLISFSYAFFLIITHSYHFHILFLLSSHTLIIFIYFFIIIHRGPLAPQFIYIILTFSIIITRGPPDSLGTI